MTNAVKYSFIIASLKENVPIIDEIKKLEKSLYGGEYECVVATQVGKARCRNLAAKKAKGKYLIFVDGDSWCHPEILIWMMFWITQYPNDYLCYPHSVAGLCCSRVLVISKEQFYALGGFNEMFHEAMDVDFGLRAMKNGIKQHYIAEEWFEVFEYSRGKFKDFVEKIRRPLERMKLLAHYPNEFWNFYAQRSLKKFVWIFVKQEKPLREHYGIQNFVRLIVNVTMLLVNLVLSKI